LVAAPAFMPAAGTYTSAQSVSISDTTAGASIYYTTDGSTPTTSSTLYTGAVSIATTTTLKAIASLGGVNSSETDGTYTITTTPPPPPAAPSFSPAPGSYSSAQSVTISDTTAGASIYYTTDGSTPTTSSTKYTGPVSIATTTTLSAIANNSGGSSSVTSGTYTITSPPPPAIEINCGGPAVSPFVADKDFTGGATIDHANTINTSKVTNPAPAAVYQSARLGATTASGVGSPFSYTIPGLTAGSSHTVRLHFCETYFKTKGSRVFNVSINGTQVLTNFDIEATAGGENIANIQQFTELANASGQYVITFTSVTNNALISGIEIDN
jgi:Malectin domain/Chitobiase/beta-hexosaminidase C-terminal domain